MPDIDYEVDGHVAHLRLNRPQRKNAFNGAMLEAWLDALRQAQADAEVRVILLGAVGDTFCAGGDIEDLQNMVTPLDVKRTLTQSVHRVTLEMHRCAKPIICSMPGAAVGAGLDMALVADYRLAARSARFAESYVNVGLVPGDGGCWLLPRLIGTSKALKLLWTGEFVSATEAAELGFVDEVCDDDALDERASALAHQIAGQPPIAIQMIKRAVRQGSSHDLETGLDLISSHMAVVKSTDDSRETLEARRERRPAVYRGR